MKIGQVLGAAVLSLTCMQANAEQVLGVGTNTCAAYTKAVGTPSEFWFESWAFGFLSAMNNFVSKKDILAGKDPEAISAALKVACEKQPLSQFAGAVIHVAGQLRDVTPDEPGTSKKKK